MSLDPTDILPFADLYPTLRREQRAPYLAAEIRRIEAAGLPLLRAILACPDVDAQSAAMLMLHATTDHEGEDLFAPGRTWRLRLADGVTPPSRDPQGRPIAPEKRGKMLAAKVGTRGAVPEGLSGPELARHHDLHSGPRRFVRSAAGQDLYHLVEITSTPKAVSLKHAIAILRQWGVGVVQPQYRRETTKDGDPRDGQCQWLVEEVCDAAVAAPVVETQRRRAAA